MNDKDIINLCRPFTMLDDPRAQQVLDAVACAESVPGVMVDIGVWKGGSTMLLLHKLIQLGQTDREVHLYDTFSGMTEPCQHDVYHGGVKAEDILDNIRFQADIQTVADNLSKVPYPPHLIHFHAGDICQVEESEIPELIAYLRLDTDFYHSTKAELEKFEPRVQPYGIVTVDDYGAWDGCRKAVDEWLASNPRNVQRIDWTGIFWIKC